MLPLSMKWFHLSPKSRLDDEISCSADGLFVGHVPLLQRVRSDDGDDRWQRRSLTDLNRDLSKRYGLPVEFVSKVHGLDAIAKALNRSNVVRAQIATLHLQIPDPPPLTKALRSAHDIVELAGRLHASGLLKTEWDADEHPRWPAGAADSQGGRPECGSEDCGGPAK